MRLAMIDSVATLGASQHDILLKNHLQKIKYGGERLIKKYQTILFLKTFVDILRIFGDI